MGSALADVIRRIVRASFQNRGDEAYYATESLGHLIDLMAAANGVSMREIVQEAITDLHVEPDQSEIDQERLNIASAATQFMIERSCDDNAARARAERRWDNFENELRWREEARKKRASRRGTD